VYGADGAVPCIIHTHSLCTRARTHTHTLVEVLNTCNIVVKFTYRSM